MPANYPKIIDVDVASSSYAAEGGNFLFKLDAKVDERWNQFFRDAVGAEHAGCFYGKNPIIKDDRAIIAYAEIEGENDLRVVLYHLKNAVRVANAHLKEVVDAEDAEEALQKKARLELEHKVKKIVGSLTFD